MIEHVRRRTLLADGLDEVVVATCDEQIIDVVEQAGGKAIMTSDEHERSSERVAEAMRTLSADVVVVVQGDEPLVLPADVQAVADPFRENSQLSCVSLLAPIREDADYANPDVVKAVCNQNNQIMYYSRAAIPHYRHLASCPVYRETGLRSFRADFLQTYVSLPKSPFEHVESIDMMRVLEHGYEVLGVHTDSDTLGVDRPEDVVVVERILRTDPVQQRLYKQITAKKV